MKFLLIVGVAVVLGGCVRQVDVDSWRGQPVSELDTHPFFITLPMTRTVTADGLEIRDYVNGRTISDCSGSGFVTGGSNVGVLSGGSSCVSRAAGCHSIFYIRNGRIVEYAPTGSGGVRCYTNSTIQPRHRAL